VHLERSFAKVSLLVLIRYGTVGFADQQETGRGESACRGAAVVEVLSMGVGDVVRVRFREGVVGESRRGVHVAEWVAGEVFRTWCGLGIREQDGEILGTLAGMPCMTCVRVLSLRARVSGERVELASEVVGK